MNFQCGRGRVAAGRAGAQAAFPAGFATRLAALVLCSAAVMCCAGCGSGGASGASGGAGARVPAETAREPSPPVAAGDSPTRGHAVSMRVAHAATNQNISYRLGRDGVLTYSAGADAAAGRATWAGPIAPADADAIGAFLEQAQALDRVKPESGLARYSIEISPPGALFGRSVRTGPTPQAEALRALLDGALRRARGLPDPLDPPPLPPG